MSIFEWIILGALYVSLMVYIFWDEHKRSKEMEAKGYEYVVYYSVANWGHSGTYGRWVRKKNMEEKVMKYGAWKVYDGRVSLGDVSLEIKDDKAIFAKGDYGIINKNHTVAIAGICLFDTSWCVQFSTGGVRSIALPLDRGRVEDRIRDRGFEVINVVFPTELTYYHTGNIDFVADSIIDLQPERLLYHIPVDEYKVYIDNLKKLIGKSIPGANDVVDALAEKVKQYFLVKMDEIGFKNFEFINPMQIGAKTPNESYALPYVEPEIFGATRENIYAIEDLVEITIAIKTEEEYGYKVPVRFCILNVPHPYMTFSKKDALNRGGITVISV